MARFKQKSADSVSGTQQRIASNQERIGKGQEEIDRRNKSGKIKEKKI